MTGKRWTREMYTRLGKMLEQHATPGDMAAKFGVSRPDINYYIRVWKDQSTVLAIPEEELELIERKYKDGETLESFLNGYTALFGKHRDTGIAVIHWRNRDKLLAAWYREKEKKKGVHKVILPITKIHEPRKEKRETPIDDGDNDVISQLKKLNNKLAELVIIQKETHELLESVIETFNNDASIRIREAR